ncbi:hypothetical protein [Vagococcus fluvialis]|uniref:helix-turn-helix domain-containing protein n=1 Tax=Vagococcus fluvialis TaxID=2738 RepID=UPI003D128083
MNEFGSIFRKLRKNKKMTLKETSENIVAHSTLASFERNEHLLGFDCLLKLLCRLNITFQEFCNYINLPQPEYQDYINQMYEVTLNKNFVLLDNLLEQLKNEMLVSNSLINKCNFLMAKSITDEIRGLKTVTEDENSYISEYLWNCEVFGHYELTLFGNTLSSLTTDSILVITNELFSRIQKMETKKLNSRDYIRAAQNSILELINRKKFESALELSIMLERIIPQAFFLEKFTNKFYWNIIMFKSTQNFEYKLNCNKQVTFLREVLNSELYEYYGKIEKQYL